MAYGVLAIIKDSERSISKESYHALACFSMRSEDEVREFKNKVMSIFDVGDYTSIRNFLPQENAIVKADLSLFRRVNSIHYHLPVIQNQLILTVVQLMIKSL